MDVCKRTALFGGRRNGNGLADEVSAARIPRATATAPAPEVQEDEDQEEDADESAADDEAGERRC